MRTGTANVEADWDQQSGLIARHIENLHRQLSRSDSLYGSFSFELEARQREARREADLLMRLAGSLTWSEVDLVRRKMLDVARKEDSWRGELAQAVLNRLPRPLAPFRQAAACRLVQRITAPQTPAPEVISAANDLTQLIPELPQSDKALILEELQLGEADSPPWKRDLVAFLQDNFSLHNAQVSRLLSEITRPDAEAGSVRKHLLELLTLFPLLEQPDADLVLSRATRWAADGPAWKRDVAGRIVEAALARRPAAANPFTSELHSAGGQLLRLRFGPTDLVPSVVQGLALAIVLLVLCMLWPLGLAPVVADSLWRLILVTRGKLQISDRGLVQRTPGTIALGVYAALALPVATLCVPLLAVGFVGKSLSGKLPKLWRRRQAGAIQQPVEREAGIVVARTVCCSHRVPEDSLA